MKKRDSIFLYILKSKPVKIVIAGFLIWNIVWFMNWYPYEKQAQNYSKTPQGYYKGIDDYACGIAAPDYLRFTGNYAIIRDDRLGIIIWPKKPFWGKTEYGIEIPVDENYIYRFYVDKNLNYLSDEEMEYTAEEEEEIKKLLKIHKDTLSIMMQVAKEEWDL